MRLICTIDLLHTPSLDPLAFSSFLTSHGVRHTFENQEKKFDFWIHEEDQIELAKTLFEDFKKNPLAMLQTKKQQPSVFKPEKVERVSKKKAKLSLCIICAVIILFIWAQFERKNVIPEKIPGVILAPHLSKVETDLLFDYPQYFVLRDDILRSYPDLTNKDVLTLEKLKQTPVWIGLYDQIVHHIKKTPGRFSVFSGNLFEKISKGEFWRFFTPALLHFDFLHIFFNLLWFVILAGQIETKIGISKFLFLILSIACISNTAQYLMSGPFFMGLSGVVCGLAAFIWARQRVAPWEGYLLHRLTLIFLGAFILGMFVLQIGFFFIQAFTKSTLSIGIANTAHIVGGLVGFFFGRSKFMSYKKSK